MAESDNIINACDAVESKIRDKIGVKIRMFGSTHWLTLGDVDSARGLDIFFLFDVRGASIIAGCNYRRVHHSDPVAD